MGFSYPTHIRKTAVWLYATYNLSCEEIARRLETSSSRVWVWVKAAGLLKAKGPAQEIYYKARHPELYEKQLRAFVLRQEGLSQQAVADIMEVSISTVHRYEKKISAMRENEHRAKVRRQ